MTTQPPKTSRPRRADGTSFRAAPSVDPARVAAARLIEAVLDKRWTLDDAMDRVASYASLTGRDRSFAAAIARATLRHLGQIDQLVRDQMDRPIADTSTWPWAILRTGAAQLLTGLAPAHAVVSRAVAVAGMHKSASGLSGLINAVLRKIAAVEAASLAPADALPLIWRRRWEASYGAEAVDAMARTAQEPAPLDLSTRVERPEVLGLEGAERLPTGSIRLRHDPPAPTALPGWDTGEIWVQDASAALPARLLNMQPGETVADLCAAPGGKTLQLAASGAVVTAVDLDPARLERLKDNLARTGLTASVFAGDARKARPDTLFDAVLLDAPCSATGTLRRHPETAWIKTPLDIPRLVGLQGELVRAAARMLRPGGRLVYAVCSLEPEEAASGVSAALEAGLQADPVQMGELPGLEAALQNDGTVRILPGLWADQGGLDGFFIARFRRPMGS